MSFHHGNLPSFSYSIRTSGDRAKRFNLRAIYNGPICCGFKMASTLIRATANAVFRTTINRQNTRLTLNSVRLISTSEHKLSSGVSKDSQLEPVTEKPVGLMF